MMHIEVNAAWMAGEEEVVATREGLEIVKSLNESLSRLCHSSLVICCHFEPLDGNAILQVFLQDKCGSC